LIEPHAHPIFAGSRAVEFESAGARRHYLEIQRVGGGILSTVRAHQRRQRRGAGQINARSMRGDSWPSA